MLKSRSSTWGILALIALFSLGGCGGDDAETPPEAAPSSPTIEAPETELQVALGSSDLAVGQNRVAFGLIDPGLGPIREAKVSVSTFFFADAGPEGPLKSANAVFRRWPVGPGGIYTARLSFDRPGQWGLGLEIIETNGTVRVASTRVSVVEASLTPAVDSPAPRTVSKTSRDVASLDELTTDLDPDPDLYSMTIAEALNAGRPLVVSFSTPAFCQTATCGPQLDVVKTLKQSYHDRVNFVHVEVYDNLDEIEGDLTNARLAPALLEWNLPSEPWTFVIDRDGLVSAKFEAFTTREELEEAIAAVLP